MSTIFLVIMVIDRQTHKPMPVKTYSLAFAGRKRNNALQNNYTFSFCQTGLFSGVTPAEARYAKTKIFGIKGTNFYRLDALTVSNHGENSKI